MNRGQKLAAAASLLLNPGQRLTRYGASCQPTLTVTAFYLVSSRDLVSLPPSLLCQYPSSAKVGDAAAKEQEALVISRRREVLPLPTANVYIHYFAASTSVSRGQPGERDESELPTSITQMTGHGPNSS